MSRKLKSPEFYEHYPALFHNYFPDIRSETFAELSEAGFSFYCSVLQLDAVIDKKELHRIFYVFDLQQDAIRKLYQTKNKRAL